MLLVASSDGNLRIVASDLGALSHNASSKHQELSKLPVHPLHLPMGEIKSIAFSMQKREIYCMNCEKMEIQSTSLDGSHFERCIDLSGELLLQQVLPSWMPSIFTSKFSDITVSSTSVFSYTIAENASPPCPCIMVFTCLLSHLRSGSSY